MLAGKPTNISISVTATRIDTRLGYCLVIIGIIRKSVSFGYEYEIVIDSEILFMGPGDTVTIEFIWHEIGIFSSDYQISARGGPIESRVNDTDLTNNVVVDGYVHFISLLGDIDGSGEVDIFDAIIFAGHFGGDIEENPDMYDPFCDINGNEEIDIFDAIILAGDFGKTVP